MNSLINFWHLCFRELFGDVFGDDGAGRFWHFWAVGIALADVS
jgi:hypothetical protein